MSLPSVTIMVYDKRILPRKPVVGSHVIKRPWVVEQGELRQKNPLNLIQPRELKSLEKPKEGEIVYDWWSKYYHSFEQKNEYISRRVQAEYSEGALKIYDDDLESNFNGFTDFLYPFMLYRGKGLQGDPEDQVGCLKGALCMYETPDSTDHATVLNNFPSNNRVDILVRVYVIEGINLSPQDYNGSSDPYLVAFLSKKNKQDTSSSAIKNNLNPIFGKMFEFKGSLPNDHTLTVTVMDEDVGSKDDLIGTTTIDLENRFFTQHRARCGIPKTLSLYGVNSWRDSQSPEQILCNWMKDHGLSRDPSVKGDRNNPKLRLVGPNETSDIFQLSDFENVTDDPDEDHEIPPMETKCAEPMQRLALHILQKKDMNLRLNDLAADLVPEHVETRTLYHPMHPKMAQGQLRLWVDIFDRKDPIPAAVNISPRVPEEYELRVIVWNVMDVPLDEISFVTKEKMSDIYVKGWLCDKSKSQKTDVHYRSMDGTGNFNWRFVFPFQYIEAENSVVVEKRENLLDLHKTKTYHKPKFIIEIWDDDKFTLDDYIGQASFDLSKMRPPLPKGDSTGTTDVNLFTTRRMKGWWLEDPKNKKSSKLELEFEILRRDEALEKPAGKGRSDPNMNPFLHKPKRPDTSFFWLFSPLRSCKYIVWRHHKWKIIGVILLIILILIIVALVYTIPSQVVRATVEKLLPGD